MSAARCAWVSYKPFDESDEADHHKVNRTFDKLVGEPMHASPMEHVATPGNTHPAHFVGWCQWRHFLEEDRRGEEGQEAQAARAGARAEENTSELQYLI